MSLPSLPNGPPPPPGPAAPPAPLSNSQVSPPLPPSVAKASASSGALVSLQKAFGQLSCKLTGKFYIISRCFESRVSVVWYLLQFGVYP